MARLTPVSHRQFVERLRELGFEGPYAGGRHPQMRRGDTTLIIPNPPVIPMPKVTSTWPSSSIPRRRRSQSSTFWPTWRVPVIVTLTWSALLPTTSCSSTKRCGKIGWSIKPRISTGGRTSHESCGSSSIFVPTWKRSTGHTSRGCWKTSTTWKA